MKSVWILANIQIESTMSAVCFWCEIAFPDAGDGKFPFHHVPTNYFILQKKRKPRTPMVMQQEIYQKTALETITLTKKT